jgi:hypothetical protein
VANQAQYEIVIPQGPKDVAHHTLQYVHQHYSPDAQRGQARPQMMGHIERGREMLLNGQVHPHDVVVIRTEDTPYSDSFVKQTGAYVHDVVHGQQAPKATITVSKSGKGGLQVWPMRS